RLPGELLRPARDRPARVSQQPRATGRGGGSRSAVADAQAVHGGRRGHRARHAREPVAHRAHRVVELVARVPDRQAPPALSGHRGGPPPLRSAARRRLRDVAQDAAGIDRGVGPARDAQLVHAGRGHGGAGAQARRVRVHRDVVVQLQQVLRGVQAMTTRSVNGETVNGAIPKLSGDIRPLIPVLGLRNYWYPAIAERRVGRRRPVKVSMLGEELCLFRGADGGVVAIQDVCPHRGARLSEGDCHYRGTVACPYHGWVYDESGKNVMVLSEGPDSGVCGKAGTEAKAYPTRTLKGLVFVWIGEGAPAPIEEDVPEEFFDEETLVLVGQVEWRCNWEVALENSMDSHVNYVHRNALVVARNGFIARGAQGEHPIFVGNGFGGDVAESNYVRQNPLQDLYPDGRKWPKTTYRRLWTWLTRPLAERARRHIPPPRSARWCGGHHPPGMFRAEFGWAPYTRMCVPVEEHRTRVWYQHCTRPKSA